VAEPAGTSLSFTEAQGFEVLGQFLQSVCAPSPITVIRQRGETAPGQNVQVPEPEADDYVVMSSLSQERLEWNETTFADNMFTASISGTVLTVTDVPRGVVALGALLRDLAQPTKLLPSTVVGPQTSGEPGGAGQYQVSPPQTVLQETMYGGVRSDLAGTKWTVQLDVHGPNSMNNARVIETLFFSEVATDFFGATGLPIAPLYSGDPHQAPFVNAEQSVEYRWVVDVVMEIGVVVGTPQQFADEVKVKTIEAAVIYTGP
jgi:hypothetical protein